MIVSTLYRHAVIASTVSIASLATPSMTRAQQPLADAIVGKWAADDGTSKLDMYNAGGEYRARLLYGNQLIEADGVTMKKDLKNPDPALRARSLKNIVFATRLVYADGEWIGGSIYDAASGRTYRCKASIKDGKLQLRGYMGIPALGRTQAFHRIP